MVTEIRIIRGKSYTCSMTDSVSVHQTTNTRRNYGIDLLRIVAMLMVCVIHVNYFTVAHYELVPGKEYFYYFGIWTESIGIIGVNLYGLITGYVCIDAIWRYSRYVQLWMLVCFYTVLIYLAGYALNASELLSWPASILHVAKKTCMMWFGSSYWYFAAYTGLFFIMPFLNELLQKLSKLRFTFIVFVLAFILPILNCYAHDSLYANGYNLAWLIVLYVVGAYIKRFSPVFLRSSWLAMFAFCSTLLPLACALFELPVSFDYAWPLTVAYAVAFFILFTRINIASPLVRRLIAWAAPSAFAVYLIHVHPWSWLMLEKYLRELNKQLDYPWWYALVCGFGIYVVCTCLDRGRIHLFQLLCVKRGAEAAADAIARSLQLLYHKVFLK